MFGGESFNSPLSLLQPPSIFPHYCQMGWKSRLPRWSLPTLQGWVLVCHLGELKVPDPSLLGLLGTWLQPGDGDGRRLCSPFSLCWRKLCRASFCCGVWLEQSNYCPRGFVCLVCLFCLFFLPRCPFPGSTAWESRLFLELYDPWSFVFPGCWLLPLPGSDT